MGMMPPPLPSSAFGIGMSVPPATPGGNWSWRSKGRSRLVVESTDTEDGDGVGEGEEEAEEEGEEGESGERLKRMSTSVSMIGGDGSWRDGNLSPMRMDSPKSRSASGSLNKIPTLPSTTSSTSSPMSFQFNFIQKGLQNNQICSTTPSRCATPDLNPQLNSSSGNSMMMTDSPRPSSSSMTLEQVIKSEALRGRFGSRGKRARSSSPPFGVSLGEDEEDEGGEKKKRKVEEEDEEKRKKEDEKGKGREVIFVSFP
jgi:hypothetical protein